MADEISDSYFCRRTRHTFASQWVLGGGAIEIPSKILGPSSPLVTTRYAHLRPDLFSEKAFDAIPVDLSQPAGNVVALPLHPQDNAKSTPPHLVDAEQDTA